MIKTPRFPSLDGWRAVSIMLVLGFHCTFAVGFPKSLDPVMQWLFDGNLGVRFFFVISGFLITHLLFHEYNQTGSISLRNFYIRRALRILPVYFVFLLAVFLLQFFTSWYQPTITWIGNLTFTTNFVPASGQTTHLWSLAVEEQFYLLWPFLLVLIGLRGNHRTIFYILGTPLLAAPICRVLSHMNVLPAMVRPFFQEFSFFNNFDSLAIGCIAAILLTRHKFQISAVLNMKKGASIGLGLVLILTPYILTRLRLGGLFTVPLGNTCQALGFAILLLQSILSPQLFKPLHWPVVKKLGVLSYSIYIWQQIFLCNPQNFGLSRFWFMSFPGALLAAILVAALSYYGLEKPLMGWRAYFRTADTPRSSDSTAARRNAFVNSEAAPPIAGAGSPAEFPGRGRHRPGH
jgi:peptidoglycan/LPS O-acetylase OafA/YrhL